MRLQVKKRTVIYLAAAILLLLTLGIGIAIVYSDYIYAPNKGFYYMKISSTDRDIRASAMGEMLDEETYIKTPEAILPIIKGSLANGLRYFSGYLENNDVVRVTGYLVKKSEIEKLRAKKQSLNNVTVFGMGAQDGGHALDRRVQHHEESSC